MMWARVECESLAVRCGTTLSGCAGVYCVLAAQACALTRVGLRLSCAAGVLCGVRFSPNSLSNSLIARSHRCEVLRRCYGDAAVAESDSHMTHILKGAMREFESELLFSAAHEGVETDE